jgi:hypothetical protein
MFQPGLGIGGEIGIVAKDILWCLEFLKLDQITGSTDVGMERVGRLCKLQICYCKIGVG